MFQILIVEDDKELSQLFQKVLEKNGYQVKSASDGAQALDVLVKEYIDLIISDIMMPVMDGYELVSELRSAGYQIPVLMITAKVPCTSGWSLSPMMTTWFPARLSLSTILWIFRTKGQVTSTYEMPFCFSLS